MAPPEMQPAETRGQLLRGHIFHCPRSPFPHPGGLVCHWDGGLLISNGRIAACGDYAPIRRAHPDAPVRDLNACVLPGLVDTHTHFPQIRALGSLGWPLLEWLERAALPEEARMQDPDYASQTAGQFVHLLLSHGTTTALAFGAHFAPATAALFAAAESSGLRLATGMVLSDRLLTPALHRTPEHAYRESTGLIRRFHHRGRLLYAVTPRFAMSASEPMLEVCRTLLRENAGVRFQTHINENPAEIAAVAKLFPWAADYLAVYERFGLAAPGAVFAHNVHAHRSEIERLAASGAAVAHCPCSNAALGSGIFPMRRHLTAGLRFSLGTDVGAGTGFGILKEGLQAYLMQRLLPEPGGVPLDGARLLYLATAAGAEALNLAAETGDFTPGKSADFICVRPPAGSPLAQIIANAQSPERVLEAIFTLAGQESIGEVRIAGAVVHKA